MLIYNQESVSANFKDYGKLKGVFTIGEQNDKIQTEIDRKTAERAEQERLNGENTTKSNQKDTERNNLLSDFQKVCRDKTKTIREEFSSTQESYKRSISKFVDCVLQLANPVRHAFGELRTLYETTFDPNAAAYPEFKFTGETERLKGFSGNKLLGKAITSSGNSPFADFIKAINATDWIRQGHERFAESLEGKCPYCQQELLDDFEKQIAACFDGQY